MSGFSYLRIREGKDMALYQVKMGRPGGGSGTFVVELHASTPDEARRTAESQNPGYKAQAVHKV